MDFGIASSNQFESGLWMLPAPKSSDRPQLRRPLDERFWEKVEFTQDCWNWTSGKDKLGYGRFSLHKQKRAALAHRIAYQFIFGPISDELEIDHVCRNRGCVNPDHLEPVTHHENIKRGDLSSQGAAAKIRQLAKTHCPHGHPYSGNNLMIQPGGGRVCRTCQRAAYSRWYWRNGGREKSAAYYREKRYGKTD